MSTPKGPLVLFFWNLHTYLLRGPEVEIKGKEVLEAYLLLWPEMSTQAGL